MTVEPTPPAPRRPFPRRRPGPGDLLALAYLALCVGLLVWALAASSDDGSGGSMAMVVPILATAPVGFVWLALPDGAAMAVGAVLLGALANAAVIVWCGRALRRGRRPDPLP
ncbi:SCO4225 family membrane protein [Streptomyces akebiae]|uniref:SCO4225 family membrane protein n=1 Tax=Streptomyces akebiae TaxID=2865673 RepID=UPI0021757B98|nr:hypothetical protein [Streptomyces akebiae]